LSAIQCVKTRTVPALFPEDTDMARSPDNLDLLIVGGGINGAGIARDAAGRGLSVALCEKDDLGAHTSSASTKLIHGGLRYLEHYHFGLVRKALKEREVLLASAPHIAWPMRFVMPHDRHLRPAWILRAGLLLYDYLAPRRHLPASAAIDLRSHPAGAPLEAQYRRGFIYSDGWVDDARLVALNALDAAERGATVLTRTRCSRIERTGASWVATLVVEGAAGRPVERQIVARAIVNACGPWVTDFLHHAAPVGGLRAVRLVKGSHIVVRRLFKHRFAYIFQTVDKRVVFAIPYEQDFTLIGTTDVDYAGDPDKVTASAEEIGYLCDLANRYFTVSIGPADVVWTYSGVRPLLEDQSSDASSVTRDYALEMDANGAPLLSVFGGKITTYRKLSEEAVDRLASRLGCEARAWTGSAVLPGGDLPGGSFAVFLRTVARHYPWLPAPLRHRYARAYGTRIDRMLSGARTGEDLGEAVVPGLYEREIAYLRDTEWARTAADILWRRTKLGLHLPPSAIGQLDAWLAARTAVA
jgi:glycerol-3-phosphate dehydrogenase